MKKIVMTKKLMTIALTLVLALPVMAKKTDTLALVNQPAQSEAAVQMENWMTDQDWLENETTLIESWMTSDDYLSNAQATVAIETWMTNGSYLKKNALDMEPWMTTLCYLRK